MKGKYEIKLLIIIQVNMIDFLIMYENKNRELEGDLILAYELRGRGYTVRLIHSHFYNGKKIKAKVMIIPFAYTNETLYNHVYRICGKQQKVINLRWEQIFTRENELNESFFCYPKEEAKKTFVVTWGPRETKALKRVGVEENRIIETGAIHLDMLHDHSLFLGKGELSKKYGIDEKKKWILFTSSFSATGLSKEEEQDIIDRMGEERIHFIKLSKDTKKELLEWFTRLIQENENVEVIYRRHPSETKDEQLNYLELKYQRFHVIFNESVNEWIYASDKVYNWLSTSAIQACILEKENVLLRPVQIVENHDYSMFLKDKKIETYGDFKKDVDIVIKKQDDLSNYREYYLIDEGAYKRLADTCETIISNDELQCNIDYKKIKSHLSFLRRIKEEVYYYHIVVVIFKIIKRLNLRVPQRIKNSYIAYCRVADNICSKEELVQLNNKVYMYMKDLCFRREEGKKEQ